MASTSTDPDLNLYPEVHSSLAQVVEFPAYRDSGKHFVSTKSTTKRWWQRDASTFEFVADFVSTNGAVLLAYSVYHWLSVGRLVRYDISDVEVAGSLIGLFYVMMLRLNGAYTRATSLLRVRETERVIAASLQLCAFAFGVGFLVELPVPRLVVLFAAASIPAFVLAEKHLIYLLWRSFAESEQIGRSTVIYGAGHSALRVFSVLARSPKLGMDPVAIVDDDAAGATVQELGYTSSRFTKVRRGPVDAALLRELSADVLIICKSIDAEEFRHIAIECARAGTVLSFVPHDRFNSTRSLSYWDADGVIFASVDEQGASSLYRLAKRAFDLSIATFLVLVLAPLLLVIALAIRVTSEGPALFVQDRVGKNGRLFKIFKFRTMYVSAEKQAYSPISTRDRRITKVGAFLRRTSLDELPQLLNVLKGDMSLVGPRPEMPFIVEQYKDIHRERLQVLPGITGLWQISAGRAQLIHENIQYDLYYIRNQSFFMDLAILLHTFVFAMRGI